MASGYRDTKLETAATSGDCAAGPSAAPLAAAALESTPRDATSPPSPYREQLFSRCSNKETETDTPNTRQEIGPSIS